MDPKSDKNETTNNPDAEFLRFWGVRGGRVFWMFLWTGKSQPKILKNTKKYSKGAYRPLARRNARGQRRGIRGGLEPLRVRQESD